MKNKNKFIVAVNRKVCRNTIVLAGMLSMLLNFIPISAYAAEIYDEVQATTEESAFDTNSEENVISGVVFEKFEYSKDVVLNNINDDLDPSICQEITNRIDVCKANTEVSENTSNIVNLVSDIQQSKQQYELEEIKAQQEAAEMAVCNAASENVPNSTPGCRSEVKTYMGYTAVTSKNSPQYKLLNSESCYTDPATGLRMVDGRYCIAVGTAYCSTIGTKIDLVLSDGSVVKCILGDVKADCDTDPTNRFHATDGSVAEFIVDNNVFKKVKDSSGTVNWVPGLSGSIQKVVIIEN